jgi:NusB family/16S rRNA methyltransferase RsmB/F
MNSGIATRVSAARVLDVVLHRGRSLKATLAAALPALADPRDRAMVEAIVFTALRQRARFDTALSQWLPKPLTARDHELRALLHAGFAQQALGMPDHAVIAATVDAARALGRPHQAALVNALLRRSQREGLPVAVGDDAWPDWLAQRIRTDWPAQAEAIFAASAEEAPMWLRVHARATTRDAYLERLREAGIGTEVDPDLDDAIRLRTALPVQQLPGFEDGVASVQDGAAQRVADALAPKPHARVLDACAAPGGKSAHLAERDPSLRITALDVDARRVRRMQARTRMAGGTARRSTRSWSTRPAAPPASCAGNRTCCCTGARPTSPAWPRCRRNCWMRRGRCSLQAAPCCTRPARSCARKTARRSTPSSRARRMRCWTRWTPASVTTPASAASGCRANAGWTAFSTRD